MKWKELKKLFKECDDDTEILMNIGVTRVDGKITRIEIN